MCVQLSVRGSFTTNTSTPAIPAWPKTKRGNVDQSFKLTKEDIALVEEMDEAWILNCKNTAEYKAQFDKAVKGAENKAKQQTRTAEKSGEQTDTKADNKVEKADKKVEKAGKNVEKVEKNVNQKANAKVEKKLGNAEKKAEQGGNPEDTKPTASIPKTNKHKRAEAELGSGLEEPPMKRRRQTEQFAENKDDEDVVITHIKTMIAKLQPPIAAKHVQPPAMEDPTHFQNHNRPHSRTERRRVPE